MNRLMTVALMTVMLTGAAEHAAAASWQLPQPSGGKLTLTVTDTVIRIVTNTERIEIPVMQVQSLHVTTRHLNPVEKWESSNGVCEMQGFARSMPAFGRDYFLVSFE